MLIVLWHSDYNVARSAEVQDASPISPEPPILEDKIADLFSHQIDLERQLLSEKEATIHGKEELRRKEEEIEELRNAQLTIQKDLESLRQDMEAFHTDMDDQLDHKLNKAGILPLKTDIKSIREELSRKLDNSETISPDVVNQMKEQLANMRKELSSQIEKEKPVAKQPKNVTDILLQHPEIPFRKTSLAKSITRAKIPSKKKRKRNRAIVTITIRKPGKTGKRIYCKKPWDRMREYGESVGADFFMINSTDHEAMILNNPDLDVHFHKFIAIEYYLKTYDSVLWFDDTILLNPNCPCTPNIFEDFTLTEFVAAKDVQRPEMSELCNRIKSTPEYWDRYSDSKIFSRGAKPCHKLKYQDNFPMFNAGLMLFRKKHLVIFRDFRDIWEERAIFTLTSTDQAVFNFLLFYHGFTWVNINEPNKMIEQGSKLVDIIVNDKKFFCMGHATKGSRHWRRLLMCDDWDFCVDDYYFTTNETIVSPLKYMNVNAKLLKNTPAPDENEVAEVSLKEEDDDPYPIEGAEAEVEASLETEQVESDLDNKQYEEEEMHDDMKDESETILPESEKSGSLEVQSAEESEENKQKEIAERHVQELEAFLKATGITSET